MIRKFEKGSCQVCGQGISHGKNCGIHAGTSDRMVGLAQEIWQMGDNIVYYPEKDLVKILATSHCCSPNTVRNHLRKQGYTAVRGWRQKDDSGNKQ